MSEKQPSCLGTAALFVGGLALMGWVRFGGEPVTYEGTGNEFQIAGEIHAVQDDGTIQVREDLLRVLSSSGDATTWFAEGKGQDTSSDRFNLEPSYFAEEDHGWLAKWFYADCKNEVTVGHVLNVEGTEIEAQDLEPGQVIILDGSIRESSVMRGRRTKYCSEVDRAVYDTVRITYTPLEEVTKTS